MITRLCDAAKANDTVKVADLLKEGEDPNQNYRNGYTPLHFAALNNNLPMAVDLVVNGNADLTKQTLSHQTPIEIAARYDAWEIVMLMAFSSATNAEDKAHFAHALLYAAKENKTDIVQALINRGNTSVSACQNLGFPMLHHALTNNWEIFNELLPSADLTQLKSGKTPIEHAAKEGKWEAVKAIAERASTDAEDKTHYAAALYYAAKANQLDVVQALIRAKAPVNYIHGRKLRFPLWFAVSHQNEAMTKALLEARADPNLEFFSLILEEAVESIEILSLLVRAKADITKKNTVHETIIQYAATNQLWLAVNIIAIWRLTDDKDEAGFGIALLLAAENNKIESVKFLLDSHTPLIKNVNNETAIEIAANKGHWEIVETIAMARSTDEEDTFNYGKALLLAVKAKQLKTVETLIKANTPLTGVEADTGMSIMHFAADSPNTEMLHLLLDHDAPFDLKNKNNQTPLQSAITSLRHESVFELVRYQLEAFELGQSKKTIDESDLMLLLQYHNGNGEYYQETCHLIGDHYFRFAQISSNPTYYYQWAILFLCQTPAFDAHVLKGQCYLRLLNITTVCTWDDRDVLMQIKGLNPQVDFNCQALTDLSLFLSHKSLGYAIPSVRYERASLDKSRNQIEEVYGLLKLNAEVDHRPSLIRLSEMYVNKALPVREMELSVFMARCYWQGIGVCKDEDKALQLLAQACQTGLSAAIDYLNLIYKDSLKARYLLIKFYAEVLVNKIYLKAAQLAFDSGLGDILDHDRVEFFKNPNLRAYLINFRILELLKANMASMDADLLEALIAEEAAAVSTSDIAIEILKTPVLFAKLRPLFVADLLTNEAIMAKLDPTRKIEINRYCVTHYPLHVIGKIDHLVNQLNAVVGSITQRDFNNLNTTILFALFLNDIWGQNLVSTNGYKVMRLKELQTVLQQDPSHLKTIFDSFSQHPEKEKINLIYKIIQLYLMIIKIKPENLPQGLMLPIHLTDLRCADQLYQLVELSFTEKAQQDMLKLLRRTLFDDYTRKHLNAAKPPNEKMQLLLEARKATVFSKHRSTFFLSKIGRTETVEKIDHLVEGYRRQSKVQPKR